jgi:gliding motility-associated-like protein
MRKFYRSFTLASSLALAVSFCSEWAVAEVTIIGGETGLSWRSGGGDLPASVIRNSTTIEQTNAPGGVIDFDPLGLPNWIVPQRADTTRNIAIGLNSPLRGGSINSPNNISIRGSLPNLIDNDGETALDQRASSGTQSAQVLGLIIDLDLGARFGLNRFKFFPRNGDPDFPSVNFPFQNEYLRGFEIFINDGTAESQFEGIPILQTVAVETQNDQSLVDLRIPPQYVRFVRLKVLTAAGFEIAEFQVFGTGFVPEASYVSNIFDFGDLALLGNLRWVQDDIGDPNLSSVRVRTRTGNDPDPVEFNKVRPGERIFRVGGGAESGNRAGTSTANTVVPWKWADDVDDAELKSLVENVLDNDEVDVREAVGIFNDLPIARQALITLDKSDYDDLRNEDKGAIRDDVTNWSGWSPPYPAAGIVDEVELPVDGAGTPITSPGPRRYFQFSIDYFSEDFEAAAAVGGLAFDVISPPFAQELVAEISPRTAEVGENTRFLYAVLNKSEPGRQRGFDRFEIETPLRVEQVGPIRIQRPDGSVLAADFSGASLTELPLSANGISIEEIHEDRFIVSFPLIEENDTVLSIEFDSGVLRFGTTFAGRAFNSALETTVGQSALAGNAADLKLAGFADFDIQPLGTLLVENLSVAVPISKQLLANVGAEPPIFTPNGDGINDQVLIKYDVTNIARLSPVEVFIYDLSGRLVRQLVVDEVVSGRFARPWDGRSDSGQLVPPGNYIYSVLLKADTEEIKEVGVTRVAY